MPRERDVVGGETPDVGGADEVFLAIVREALSFGGIEELVWAAWVRLGSSAGVISGAQPVFFLPGFIGTMCHAA